MALTQKIPGPERIRGPNLASFITNVNGVTMEEALRRTDKAGLVIASNKRLGKALVGSNEWRQVSDVFTCWSGTMAAYDKPGQKLGKMIEYTDPLTRKKYIFPVPEEHQGKKNVILVAEHPDFTLERDGKTSIVQAKKVGIVEEFPVSNNYYLADPKYGIPTGEKVDYFNPEGRLLARVRKWVGLVACKNENWTGHPKQLVYVDKQPSDWFGAAIENPLPTNDAPSLSMSQNLWGWLLKSSQVGRDSVAELMERWKVRK
jgi:hypothetical protein